MNFCKRKSGAIIGNVCKRNAHGSVIRKIYKYSQNSMWHSSLGLKLANPKPKVTRRSDQCWNFLLPMETRNRVVTGSSYRPASLCSLVGQYDNPIPTRFLASTGCSKITAQPTSSAVVFCPHKLCAK